MAHSSQEAKSGWALAQAEGRIGTGNWDAWTLGLEPILFAANKWRNSLLGIKKPWLCWNIHDDWCQLQQKLILEVGWTPVVGGDTSVKNTTIIDGAHYVDFNSDLRLPTMWMHFPLEFVYLFCDKLAFWHSDFLCSIKDMQKYSKIFDDLENGCCAAAYAKDSRWPWRDKTRDKFFELIGCTTEGASKSQFENGAGWWRHIERHPKFNPNDHSGEYRYEHGVGVLVWKKKFGGKVIKLSANEKLGHCDRKKETLAGKSTKFQEMEEYYDIRNVSKRLGIDYLL